MRLTHSLFIALLTCSAVAADSTQNSNPKAHLQAAFDSTLSAAVNAVGKYGPTDSAMILIQSALAKLASEPGLKDQETRQQLHGSSKSHAVVLASRGDDSVTLFLSEFENGQTTPIHDHQTWGVLFVLEGRDHYTRWTAEFHEADSSHAATRVASDTVLTPGSSIYWLPPPADMHTQSAADGTVRELVLAGRNFLSSTVSPHRHYFDPKTGDVSHTPPK